MAPRRRRRRARRSSTASARQSPEALAGIATLRGHLRVALLRAARPRHRPQRELGRDRVPGPAASAPPADRERPLRIRRPPAAEETIEADVCVVGSGAGGGVVAASWRQAGKSVVVLEAGAYHDDADFDGLELSAYQRMYLNGGPFPTAEGQVSIVAGSGRRRRHGDQLDQLPAHRTTTSAPSGPPSTGSPTSPSPTSTPTWTPSSSASQVNADCSDLNGPHQRLKEACEQARLRLPRRSPATPTARTYRPETRRLHGLRRPVRLEALDGEDLPASTPRTTAPRSSPAPAPSGSWSRTGAPPGSRPSWADPSDAAPATAPPTRLTVGRRSWSSPAARSSRRRCCCARGSAAPRSATTCGCTRRSPSPPTTTSPRTGCGARRRRRSRTSSPTLGEGYGFLIESAQATTGLFGGAVPWRSGADHKRRMREWAQAALLIAPRARARPRPGRDRRRRQRRPPLPDRRRARPRAT